MKTLNHPYENLNGGRWVRGNLHTHTTASDGARPIAEVVDDYRDRGYGFLMISDHDVYTSVEALAEMRSEQMILIPGNEITASGSHILHVNASGKVPPSAQRQTVLNAIALDESSFAIVAHPNWQERFDHTTISQLTEWVGYAGIEIYNGVIGRLHGSPYATNKWDMLLAAGRRVWGYAHDDSHRLGDIELGWNQVYVRENSCGAIVSALRKGEFCASTGVTINDIRVEGLRIRLETANAERIVALREVGRRFATVDSKVIEVDVPENANYVRFECWGRGEQMAWTQPFFVTEC